MTLKQLLETILMTQKITLKRLVDFNDCEDIIIFDKLPHEEIPYAKVAEFLDWDVVTVEALMDEDNQPYLYVEI